MEAIISSAGVYHAYHLARAAANANVLKRFIIGICPKDETGIPDALYKKIQWPYYLGHLIQQFPDPNSQYLSYLIRDNLFDLLARVHVDGCDIFHGWNNNSLFSMRRAKGLGAKVAIERGSSHPVFQMGLLREEFEKFGIPYPTGMKWLIKKHLQEYEEADAIFVCSDFVQRTMLEQGVPAEKLRLTHLGFDPLRFKPGKKQDKVFRIIYAGNIGLRKGIPYLLEAFKKLNLPNSELILVGGKSTESQAFLPQYDGLYRHIPFMPQSELNAYYNNSSVFILPSLEDGFGMVVYEAAACGLPVIVTENVGASIRDGQDGYIIPIRDADALAGRILHLYQDENLRQAMGESARAYVQQYTWEAYHRQMIQHYQELAG